MTNGDRSTVTNASIPLYARNPISRCLDTRLNLAGLITQTSSLGNDPPNGVGSVVILHSDIQVTSAMNSPMANRFTTSCISIAVAMVMKTLFYKTMVIGV